MGVDAIVMAYGQTGSGKSLTIAGLYNSLQVSVCIALILL